MGVPLIALDLGGGKSVVADYPPTKVLAAASRMRAALERGQKPASKDAIRVWRWLEQQDRRHGGVRS